MTKSASRFESSNSVFRIPHSALVKMWIAAAFLAYIYYPSFVWMWERWMARDSYYSHGILIPFVTAYWIWKKKAVLAACPVKSDVRGLPLLIFAALLELAAGVFRIYFLSSFSLVLLLLGAVWFLFGRAVLRKVWFPIGFLFIMIPLPLLVISEVTLKMKFFVAEIAAMVMRQMGIEAVREGSYIFTPHAAVLVGDPCSGLRSFLAFLCLGLVLAYGAKMALWKKVVLAASGLPLAILSNVVRVFVLSLLSEIYGTKAIIESWFHDASGFVVFALAFWVFLLIRKKLEPAHVSA